MDRPELRVLYISHGYTTHDRRFMTSFAGEGWDVRHLPLTDQRLDDRPVPAGVETMRWTHDMREPESPSDWVDREKTLRAILGATSPDVVIAGPVQTGAYIAALAGAGPLMTVSWGTDMLVDADRNAQMRMATSYTLDRSDAVFGDCRAVREAVKRHAGMPDNCIVTFPWGIDLERFTPGRSKLPLRQDLGWEESEVFVSTRSWEPVYAIDTLVEAFATVHATRPRARLILLGNGSERSKVTRLIHAHQLDAFVHMPGRVSYDRLPDYFRVADAYVSSAISDGTSVSLLEAMATGLPAVVTDSYGNLEWVERGVNGALARPGDAAALANAMISVIANPARSARMGEVNVVKARATADWKRNFPLLARLIVELAG